MSDMLSVLKRKDIAQKSNDIPVMRGFPLVVFQLVEDFFLPGFTAADLHVLDDGPQRVLYKRYTNVLPAFLLL